MKEVLLLNWVSNNQGVNFYTMDITKSLKEEYALPQTLGMLCNEYLW